MDFGVAVSRRAGGARQGILLASQWCAKIFTNFLRKQSERLVVTAAIREDQPDLAAPTAALSRGLDALCLDGRGGGAAAFSFPPDGEVYRGGGFDDAHRDFFAVGKQFRVPGFLATSFSRAKAEEFRRTQEAWGRQGVLWIVRVDPAGEAEPSKRCRHVNFVSHSLVADHAGNPLEQEYLFAAYSIFTVRAVAWGEGGAPHRIELDAASDNGREAEGGAGRWATPAGSEALPLAPWY